MAGSYSKVEKTNGCADKTSLQGAKAAQRRERNQKDAQKSNKGSQLKAVCIAHDTYANSAVEASCC